MTYTNKLRGPTDEEMKLKCVPLVEQFELAGRWRDTPRYPSLIELLKFMVQHDIPTTAAIGYGECGSHTLELTW